MSADKKHRDKKSFERKILEAYQDIEQANQQLYNLETILKEVCREIESSLGFDFAGISLIYPEKNTIEAVSGTGIAERWSGIAGHHLEDDPDLRDIQADIVKTYRTEIISGWDKRFDRFIFQNYRHDLTVHVYTPILLVKDENGNLSEDWFERFEWKQIEPPEKKEDGQHLILEMCLPDQASKVIKVIGTVETGYENPERLTKFERLIKFEQVVELAKLVARQALNIYRATLPYVLKTIAESAMYILNADAASLHFPYDFNQKRHIYRVCAGLLTPSQLDIMPPPEKGLGQQAIWEKKTKFIPDPRQGHGPWDLERFNPEAWKMGAKAIAAFPLIVEDKEGILYLTFHREHQFTEDDLRWGEIFARRAVDVIQQARNYQHMRDQTDQLAILQSVTQSLAQKVEREDLLRYIAWSTLNILAADVVTIYEYIQTEKQFLIPPKIAGKLKVESHMHREIARNNLPFKLVEYKENVFAHRLKEYPSIFEGSPFVEREEIRSFAGILIKVEEEIVGVMFINYRRPHDFSKDEQQIIESLASSAAIAIKNQRWLTTLSDIDRDIIITLDQKELLNKIVRQTVQITGAEKGNILLLDPITQELVIKTSYPANVPYKSKRERLKLGEGITGWVAKNRQSALVDNVQNDPRYRPYYENINSQLCVPLFDKDRVLGVLNVESSQIEAFDQGDLQRMKALANQTVIAIQNAEKKKQLVAVERITTLGEFAAPLMHKLKNYLGAIKVWTKDILDEGNDYSQKTSAKILELIEQVLQEINSLGNWIEVKRESIDLQQILFEVFSQGNFPSNITSRVDIQDKLPEVSGGEPQLINVFSSLIQNAIEAMPEGGNLSIESKIVEQGGRAWVMVSVKDRGIGIAPEHLEQIFNPEYTTKPSHSGFGLWWTKAYVERLGGWLTVKSDLGKGTEFTVVLPVCQSEA